MRLVWIWLLVCCVGQIVTSSSYAPEALSTDHAAHGTSVQLRRATLPAPVGLIAVHYWFAEYDPADQQWHRWEVWQTADSGGTAWGYVHKDKLHPAAGVGGGASVVAAQWQGEDAERLAAVLHRSSGYPLRDRYRAWPGPNSNTYIAWVLREAEVRAELDPRAIGRDYLGAVGVAKTTTGSGIQVESPIVGLKVGWRDGAEVHVGCFTLGIDVWPPAIKTPFGRLGFSE